MGDYFSSVSTEMFRKFTSTALTLALLAALISASPAVGGKDQTRHDIILSHYQAPPPAPVVFSITTTDPPGFFKTRIEKITYQNIQRFDCGTFTGIEISQIDPYQYVGTQRTCGDIRIEASVNGIKCLLGDAGKAVPQGNYVIRQSKGIDECEIVKN